jgi:hypothetical protein
VGAIAREDKSGGRLIETMWNRFSCVIDYII